MPETQFKQGFQPVIGEQGTCKDWGGERNDLWTTRLQLKSTRVSAAVAFKGPGITCGGGDVDPELASMFSGLFVDGERSAR
jgi:N-acetylglutamate synthase/N-acetylornithine aminotransferase